MILTTVLLARINSSITLYLEGLASGPKEEEGKGENEKKVKKNKLPCENYSENAKIWCCLMIFGGIPLNISFKQTPKKAKQNKIYKTNKKWGLDCWGVIMPPPPIRAK